MDDVVSVIVPVYNNEPFLRKCLESLIHQTYTALEILIVDDGSTDRSHTILEDYAARDHRIRLITQDNHGVSHARNTAIVQATGAYMTFVDGDDYVGIDYINRLVNCAKKNRAGMVVCGLRLVDTEGKTRSEIRPGIYERFTHEEWPLRISAVAAHLYERELWELYHLRFYEGERGEDMPVSLYWAARCKRIATLSQAEYYYVQHSRSAMHSIQKSHPFPLPYRALEQSIAQSREFHELFVLRILLTFARLSKGASVDRRRELREYIVHILNNYYPECYRNAMCRIRSGLDIPLAQRLAVKVFAECYHMGWLRPLLYMICR